MERPGQGLNALVNKNESAGQILYLLFTNEKADDDGGWQIEAKYCHTGLVRTVPGRHHYSVCFEVITSHWGMF